MLLTLAGGVLYYFLFEYLVSLNNYGIVIFYVPIYLVYLLSLTASLLLTVTVYAFSSRIRQGAGIVPSRGLVGSISAAVGGCVGGCACQAPILYNIFYLIGLNAFEASGVVTLIASYQTELNVLLILLNAVMTNSILSKVPLTTALGTKPRNEKTNNLIGDRKLREDRPTKDEPIT